MDDRLLLRARLFTQAQQQETEKARREVVQNFNRAEEQRRLACRTFGSSILLPSVRVGEDRFCIGDRVLFHKPYRPLAIENGYRGTVVGVDQSIAASLCCSTGSQLLHSRRAGSAGLPRYPLRKLGLDGMTLGFAATTHKMQGQTCSHSYLLLGGRITDREMG